MKYDCIVYGNDIYGLTIALFLARKMRKVLVLQDNTKPEDNFETIDIVDPENRKYHFDYNSLGMLSGYSHSGLLNAYLDDLGLENELETVGVKEETIVYPDHTLVKRFNTTNQFKVHLIRHYPKHRNHIHKFFVDLDRMYRNYTTQYVSMLRNTEYTLTSLMIEWGNYSLEELLDKYFTSEELKQEFSLNSQINGLNRSDVNSYNFFSSYFVGLMNGFDYLVTSEAKLRDIIIAKLKLIDPRIVHKTRIKSIETDDGDKILSFTDKDDKQYSAKYYFVESEPEAFYSKYFKEKQDDLDSIHGYYPNFNKTQKINTMYLAINDHPKNLGLEDMIYYFSNREEQIKIVKLFNYSLFENSDKRRKHGLLCLDYTYDEATNYHKDDLLRRVYDVFPKLKKAVVGVREGKPKRYLTMLHDTRIRKNLSINEMIEIESLEHIQVFDNLYLGSKYMRPEAGLFGIFNQAIIFADKIEDRLYFGDDDEPQSSLSNEEIMMMIRHNFNHEVFGNQELHINFHIGKSTYFIRTKGKNIVIHQGKYAHADLSIYTNNDRLSNLLLKKTTFNEVLEEGSLKYRGDKDLLFQAVDAFTLDDYQEYNPLDFITSRFSNMGAKILFIYFGIYSASALLTNYLNGVWIYPIAFGLTLLTTILKIRAYERVYWFDIFINVIFLGASIAAFSSPWVNQLRMDDPLLGVMALALLISVFTNHPVVYHYTKYDQNIDYRGSVLFRVICNGLTFFWGFLFLAILVGTYITGERYVSVLYFFYFLGIFLMYYYPIIYVKTNIKK
ncbi:MAG: hypothetical protein JXB08_04820 [Bacilli bacterium]|nr:hypothetical protein [Bacilli bacterium]